MAILKRLTFLQSSLSSVNNRVASKDIGTKNLPRGRIAKDNSFIDESRENGREKKKKVRSKAIGILVSERDKSLLRSSECVLSRDENMNGGKNGGSGAFTRRNGKFDPILRAYYQSREYVIPISLSLAVLPSVSTVPPCPHPVPVQSNYSLLDAPTGKCR